MLERLDRFPAAAPGRTARLLWAIALSAGGTGLISWGTQTLQGGVIALWAFAVAAVALGLVLPLPLALVAPLYMGVAGWLVDMLPFVILLGWAAVVVRWAVELLRDRRWPRGGRWFWIPVFLVFWTGAGVIVITSADFKHFLLLLGVQVLASGAVLAAADGLRVLQDRRRAIAALVGFVILLSSAVFLQWIGIDLQALQNGEVRKRVEAAYGVDAFPNNIGMIKYARSINAGALELRQALDRKAQDLPDLPPYSVFRPSLHAYENSLVVRFAGSARGFESELAPLDIDLLYDNIGLAPANTVPRMRSFPRNALTYAGICAALFPLAFFLYWRDRKRAFAVAGVVACLFGVGFSLARGAWVAVLLGIIYLLIDGRLDKRQKTGIVIAYLVAAVVLTGVFLVKYRVDPLNGRAGGGESVATREDLYKDTLGILKKPKYALLGFGTEQPRTPSGTVREGARYVPRSGTHSTYLNYLFRTGVPGLLAILAVYALAWLHGRAASRLKEDDERLFAVLLAASIVIAGAHAVILSLYVEPIYTLTISILLGVAIGVGIDLGHSIRPRRSATT